MVRFQRVGEVNYRPDNADLRAELFPGNITFMSERNLKAVLAALQLPRTPDGSAPISLSELAEMAEQVYEWDVDGRAAERAAVTPSGVDYACVTALITKWNQELQKRLVRKHDTDFGPAVSYNFGYDVGSYLGEFPLYSTGKTGVYSEGAGGFLDDREYQYTSDRLRGRPIDVSHEIDLRIPAQTYFGA